MSRNIATSWRIKCKRKQISSGDRDRLECAGVMWVKMWSPADVPSGIHCSALIAPIILWDRMSLWCWTALRGRKHRQQAENVRKDICKHLRSDWRSTQSKMTCNQHRARGSCGKNNLDSKIYFSWSNINKIVYSKRRLPKFPMYVRKTIQKAVPFTYIQIKHTCYLPTESNTVSTTFL